MNATPLKNESLVPTSHSNLESASTPKKDGLELLWGADLIAAELNITTRQAFYLLERGHIPARKIGGRWCASRRALRSLFGVA
jgi:hypothetical protein